MKIIFWISLSALAYLYFGYPVMVYILSVVRKRPIRKKYFYPAVSVIISAYNEEKYIGNKIKSLLNTDYPPEKIEILIGSDGSTDRTGDIASKYLNGRIKLITRSERKGKPSMLNVLASKAKGDIFVFTDVRQELDGQALKELISNFYDEKIGSVSTELIFKDENNKSGNGIGFYWKYEKFIRNSESQIGSMLGATGGMYAIRRELFSELPEDLILDDVYIPLKIIQKGYRAVFDTNAKIYDNVAKDAKHEFSRKARTHSGNFQVFSYFKGLFNPFKSPVAIQLFSHKFLRLIGPYLLGILFVSNLFILDNGFYSVFFISQLVFYINAILGAVFPHANRIFDIPHMFCVMNSAAVVGLYRFLTSKHNVLWHKAEAAQGIR